MGAVGSDELDPATLTSSGSRCLEELTYVATLAYDEMISTEWVVVSCATSVETHFNRLIEALVSKSGLRESRLGSALIEQVADDMVKTWDSRLRWLSKGFGISISDDVPVRTYLSVVDLRNAIVHGQGELTQLQQRSFTKMIDLKKTLTRILGVEFRGSVLILNDDVQLKVLRACRNVVLHVDQLVLGKYAALVV